MRTRVWSFFLQKGSILNVKLQGSRPSKDSEANANQIMDTCVSMIGRKRPLPRQCMAEKDVKPLTSLKLLDTSNLTVNRPPLKKAKLQSRRVTFEATLTPHSPKSKLERKSFKTGCPGVFTDDQRTAMWIQQADLENLISDIRLSLRETISSNQNFLLYLDTLLKAYIACDQDVDCNSTCSNQHEQDISLPTSNCDIVVLGLSNEEGRGLETYAVPALAQTRITNRAQHVRQIVLLYRSLRGQPKASCQVGQIARKLSQTSRNFARVMAAADAAAALTECTSDYAL